jgi:SAM-dependent methyltransferase
MSKAVWELIKEELGAGFAEDRQLQADIRRLSLAFTEGRGELEADYLENKRQSRAYLAYFLPLNFEKVRTLFEAHSSFWPETLPARPQRWLDLGCGPGTATLAALLAYRTRYRKTTEMPAVQIDLVDSQESALEMAETLVRDFATKQGLNVSTRRYRSWSEVLKNQADASYDLALAANVLNELPAESGAEGRELLLDIWDRTTGAFLVLEPGHRVSSQRLIRFRERLLKAGKMRILGPCSHVEKCPLHRSKHWCHFSEPNIDGQLIDLNLRVFKNPRAWLKFSYVFFKREEPSPRDPRLFRAIGDLHLSQGKLAIDLCQPEFKKSLKLPRNLPPDLRTTLVRGALVQLSEDGYEVESAVPLSPRDSRNGDPKNENRGQKRDQRSWKNQEGGPRSRPSTQRNFKRSSKGSR